MRPAVIKAYSLGIITGSFLTAGLIYAAAPAKADGNLDSSEADYVLMYGEDAICPVIDKYHSMGGVMGVAKVITDDGFTADSAVDIINSSVSTYCPRNWPLLVSIGKAARGETAAYKSVTA